MAARKEMCPRCGSDDIYKCRDSREPNGDCFQCGGCNILLPNDELKVIRKSKHVTTYDELLDAAMECRGELEDLMECACPDFKDTEKLLMKLERLIHQAKKRGA